MTAPKAPTPILRGALRDLANQLGQGSAAPKSQERIWIDPSRLTRIYTRNPAETPDFKRRHSGMVIDGDWDLKVEPIDQSWKIAACLAHFRDQAPWSDTGVYDHMTAMIAERGQFDSCRTMEDILTRYAQIDLLFDAIRTDGFRDDTVIKRGTPRLPEGVFIHIDRTGDPIFGAIGNHRIGIARALRLTRIPAQLGVVHPEGAPHLARYRDAA
ncbi:hypothetical protein MWU54_05065 [Marivita sp. S6314]|uniref:hypothetical protein n=1 Tax=Marivita sp. S6314 TaxID=2926406 RepID=UPI001FF55F20|nr:hypothetical protein [Marivita sp. S6314]MCK0149382.1 hypothetical protein [Marivita sp. S6314]